MQQTLSLTRMNASSASPLKRCGLVVYLSNKKSEVKFSTNKNCMPHINHVESSRWWKKLSTTSASRTSFFFLFNLKIYQNKICEGKRRKAYKYAWERSAQARVDTSSPFRVVFFPVIPIHLSLNTGWSIMPRIWWKVNKT